MCNYEYGFSSLRVRSHSHACDTFSFFLFCSLFLFLSSFPASVTGNFLLLFFQAQKELKCVISHVYIVLWLRIAGAFFFFLLFLFGLLFSSFVGHVPFFFLFLFVFYFLHIIFSSIASSIYTYHSFSFIYTCLQCVLQIQGDVLILFVPCFMFLCMRKETGLSLLTRKTNKVNYLILKM